ncbi:MAG: type 2 lanthipeptide synthetase LanM family protein [Rivularia sp. (in: cyanobacteria)]
MTKAIQTEKQGYILSKELVKIVEKSSTISERLGDNFYYDRKSSDDDLVNNRIFNWCQTLVDGNQEKFEKRLAWDNLDLDKIRDVFGEVKLIDEDNLSTWANILKEVLENSELQKYSTEDNNFINSQEPLPFEDVFISFIHVARKKLKAQAGYSYSLLSSDVHAKLERYLLNSLIELCNQTMALELQIFFTYERPTLNRWLTQFNDSHSKVHYNKFVDKMLSGGLLKFFQKYSVLARLVGTTINFWVTNINEFLQRLKLDWSEIEKTFQENSQLGQVIDISAGVSDLHNQGRSVLALKFSSQLKLVYKPKNLALDVAFFELVKWLNEHKTLPQLKLMKVLNRSNYGWVEYIEHLPLKDSSAAVRYYHRAGMLSCLLYVLSGGDFHYENIIASGEYPVAIDLEMLMSGKICESGGLISNKNAVDLAVEKFQYSVLSTSLFPKWEIKDGVAYDISGLAGSGGQKTTYRSLVWKNINTDAMVLSSEAVEIQDYLNIPILDGCKIYLKDYLEAVVDGFRSTYKFLMSHTDVLLQHDGLIARFANQQVRALFRPSQIYYSFLKQTLQPKYLQSGVDRDIALDLLSKACIDSQEKPDVWQIIIAEKEAMQDLDIPLFTAQSGRDAFIINDNQVIDGYYEQPSYEFVTNRLQQLNENDLEQQIGLIRSSVYASMASEVDISVLSEEEATSNKIAISPLTKETLIQQATNIAEEMQKRAMRATDGSPWWMGMEYIPGAGQLQPRSLGFDLYDGCAGVALFFAALAKTTGNNEYRNLALSTLLPVCNLSQSYGQEYRDDLIQDLDIGAGKGIASIIYTLVQCSKFLNYSTLLEDAQKFVSLLTPTDIIGVRKFDLVSGTAGLILGLLTFYDATQDSQALELAKICGYHLIDNRITSKTGFLTWNTVGGKPLTGIAHGAAGIAYALLRLSTVVIEPKFLQAAQEAIAYENSVFYPQVQNWLDLRSDRQAFGTSWCNGAPGIGLARLGSLKILDKEVIRQDIETALETTQKIGLHNIDHLCCGNLGYAELFLFAGLQLGRLELIEIAQKQAAYVVNRAENIGYFQIFPSNFQGIYNPGFFQGMAGIGYELLRLAYPQELPSVLLWEMSNE